MALNVNAALMQLDPLKPLGPRPDKKAESMERQRLQLMREQFEETKRQNAQDAEWRKIAEAGAMTREQMASDRQAEHDRQAAVAENIKQRTLAFDSFNKRVDSADYEGMDLDATRINQLGGLVERTGEDENGFPSYRVEFDAEEVRKRDAEQEDQTTAFFDDSDEGSDTKLPREAIPQSLDRLNALGYDTLGLRDNLAGTGVGEGRQLSTEDAFRSAQRAARGPDEKAAVAPEPAAPKPWQPGDLDRDEPEPEPADPGAPYDLAAEADAAKNFLEPGRSTPMATPPPQLEPSIFQATGRPARVGQRDIMGGVPKNVVDTGSMQDQRLQRLGPVMDNMVKSMPEAYRAGTRANADAALGMGLPADKAAKQALDFNAPANAATASELEAERKEKAEERKAIEAAKLDPKAQEVLHNFGLTRARNSYKDMKIDLRISGMERADEVVRMLTNDNTADDAYAINKLMVMDEQSGAQSNADALRLSGGETLSTIDQAKAWLHKQIDGGYWDKQKAAMLDFAAAKRASYRDIASAWVLSQQDAADKALHPLSRAGRLEFLESLPAWFIKEHDEAGGDDAEEEKPAAGTTASNASLYQAPPPAGSATPPPSGAMANDTEFMTSLTQNAAAYKVDPNKMLTIIGPESLGGDPTAKNPNSSASGLIQMIDSVAQQYINPRTNEKFKNAAELRTLTRAEQAPIAAKYFADKGLTVDSPVEDYALAVAAPYYVGRSDERDTVVYPKGSKEHKINRPWWPADGGDITVGSIIDMYVHEPAASQRETMQMDARDPRRDSGRQNMPMDSADRDNHPVVPLSQATDADLLEGID